MLMRFEDGKWITLPTSPQPYTTYSVTVHEFSIYAIVGIPKPLLEETPEELPDEQFEPPTEAETEQKKFNLAPALFFVLIILGIVYIIIYFYKLRGQK